MHQVLRLLSKVAERYAPSRLLSFDSVHVLKAMQLMENKKKISRSLLIRELGLGEGSVKTLVKHMKMSGLIENSNAGMWSTNKGKAENSARTMWSGPDPAEEDAGAGPTELLDVTRREPVRSSPRASPP